MLSVKLFLFALTKINMAKSYSKGYRAENELLHILHSLGWAVIRAPRSGRVGIPSPDLLAIKNGKVVVIECKSRAGAFTVPQDQLEQLTDWERRAGAQAYVAWKQTRKGFSFITLKDVLENNGNVGKKFAESKGRPIDAL